MPGVTPQQPAPPRRPQTAGRKRPTAAKNTATSEAHTSEVVTETYAVGREQQLLKQAIRQDEEVARLKAELVDLRSKVTDDALGTHVEDEGEEEEGEEEEDTAAVTAHRSPRKARGQQLYDVFPASHLTLPPGALSPFAMESHSISPCGGRLYLVGGTNGSHLNSDTWAYSLQQRRWRKLRTTGNSPLGRYGHAATVCRGKLYIHGGYGLGGITTRDQQPADSSKGALRAQTKTVTDPALWHSADQGYQMIRCGLLNSLFCLDLESNVWTELQTADREYLKNHSAVVHRGRIFYFGGCLLEGRTNVVRVFDTETKRWLTLDYFNQQLHEAGEGRGSNDIPTVRSGHTANLLTDGGPRMVIFGGRMSKFAYCNDTFCYRFDSRRWEKLYCGGELPEPRSAHAAVCWRDNLIAVGGYAYESGQESVHATTASPLDAASAGSPRRTDRKQYYGDCYVLNIAELMWRRVSLDTPHPLRGRCGHSLTLYEDVERGVAVGMFGGWGDVPVDQRHLNDEDTHYQPGHGLAYGTNNEQWVFSIAPPAPPSARPVQASPARARPPSARPQRNITPHRPQLRPTSAPASGRRATTQSRSNTPRPWRVATSKATTAREFGELPVPTPPQGQKYGERDIDGIVSRLADGAVKEKERMRDQLLKRVLNGPGGPPTPKRMNHTMQKQFLRRNYFNMEEQAIKRRALQEKYAKTAPPARLQGAVIEEMVERLHRAHSPTNMPETERQIHSKERIEATVNRLYVQGMQHSADRQAQLHSKYCFSPQMKQVDGDELNGIVSRLYAGERAIG